MAKPIISVICCNYNHAQYIQQAAESIVYQTFPDWELLIVDDGSTDNSKEVINELIKLDERIKTPIFLGENKGKWFALNTAIAKAEGKLITLNDADDLSHRVRLERQHYVLNEFKSYHNLCGFQHCHSQRDIDLGMQWDEKQIIGYDIISQEEVLKNVHYGHKTSGINHYFVAPDYEAHGATCLFYKQHWTYGMKFLPGNMGLRCQKAEDSDFNTKMTLLLQRTTVLKEPLYMYRRNTSTNPAWLEDL